jgi:hypothetical protein
LPVSRGEMQRVMYYSRDMVMMSEEVETAIDTRAFTYVLCV